MQACTAEVYRKQRFAMHSFTSNVEMNVHRYTISLEDSLSTLSAAMNSIMQASNVLASPVVPLEKLVHTEIADYSDVDDDDNEDKAPDADNSSESSSDSDNSEADLS
eukprot:TRINITY_DN12142_c0_g2_i30.p2 TRINITY_DN12142_c0_g2~~TRINITY_DN12142_c0_g2_i30.p2  ORF type:complete len:107 (+),score=32.13 TRINITY_DN12142_c0_g2_i30:1065-1385(+)